MNISIIIPVIGTIGIVILVSIILIIRSMEKRERIKSPRELVQLQRTYGRMQERLITAQNRLKELNFSLEEKVKKQVQTIQRHELWKILLEI